MEQPRIKRLEHGIPEIVKKLMHTNALLDHPRKDYSIVNLTTRGDDGFTLTFLTEEEATRFEEKIKEDIPNIHLLTDSI